MRRPLAAVAVAAALVAAAVLVRRRSDEDVLPAQITVTDVVDQLSATLPAGAVEAESAAGPVHRGVLQPGEPLRGAGPRASLVAPPRSRIRLRATAPAHAALLFGVGVEGRKRREPGRSGIRFTVTVDGHAAWSRVVNPAATQRDRQWFDERIELADGAGPVEIVLGTDPEEPGSPLAGTPGWSRVRIVHESSRPRQPARPDAPNVLVLLVDTLRADHLGCYGATPSPSPALDRLAAGGLLFERAVAQSSWTMASVASIFTGRHPRSHGAIRDRARAGAADDDGTGTALPDGAVTWAEAAVRAGISTFGVSSNPLVSRATNLAQGFETFREFTRDPEGRTWTAAAEVNRLFLRWLGRNRDRRFVAYLHYMEPHDPYAPPPALRPPAPPGIRPVLLTGWVRDVANRINWHGGAPLSHAEVAHLRALYTGDVRAWDGELPALLDGLAALGVRDSTVVIVTADHGEEFQEHGRLTHGSHLYDESIHVPLVIAGPGVGAERRADLAQGIDLFPTLAAVLGLEPPPDLPGRDLLATRAPAAAISETARGIAPDGSTIDVVSVTTPAWKLIRTPALDRWELYDLDHDPGERDDRWARGGAGTGLAALLAGWEATAPAPAPAAAPDPALAEKLRALGYVE